MGGNVIQVNVFCLLSSQLLSTQHRTTCKKTTTLKPWRSHHQHFVCPLFNHHDDFDLPLEYTLHPSPMSSPIHQNCHNWLCFVHFVFLSPTPRMLIFNSSITTSYLSLDWPLTTAPSSPTTRTIIEIATTENRLQVRHYYDHYHCLYAKTKIRISHVWGGISRLIVRKHRHFV